MKRRGFDVFMAFCNLSMVVDVLLWFNTDGMSSWETKAYAAFTALMIVAGLNVVICWSDTYRWWTEACDASCTDAW